MTRWLGAAAVIIAAAIFWRPTAAWWCDDMGNLAFVRGDDASAASWFSRGLGWEPGWHLLLEDHGRAILDVDPGWALSELRTADCGDPCVAEAGDAESRLGRAQDAVRDYLAAHAVERLSQAVDRLSRESRYDDAIALERALAARLGSGMLAQADLATAYFTIGDLDARAAHANRRKRLTYQQDAIRSYGRASELAPFNEGYLLSLGNAQRRWGSKRAAVAAFERVLELHPHESAAEQGLSELGIRSQESH